MEDNYKPDLEVVKDSPRVDQELNKDWKDLRESYIKEHKTELLDDDMTMFTVPKSGCRHCHGTGVEGVYDKSSRVLPNELIICRCITYPFGRKPTDTTEYLSYGVFRKMMKDARKRFNLKEPENETTAKNDSPAVQGTGEEVGAGGSQTQPAENSNEAVGEGVVS